MDRSRVQNKFAVMVSLLLWFNMTAVQANGDNENSGSEDTPTETGTQSEQTNVSGGKDLHLAPMKVIDESVGNYRVETSSTVTRTDTPLQQTPMSVQIIPRALLDDQQATTMSEALHNVAGVIARVPDISPNFEPTLIRGFSAMQMLDGFYQNLNTGDQGSLINLQQIDVIKGANATLYSGGGGSPVGGVINMVSKRPQHQAFYELGAKLGSDSFIQPYLDINQPLNENVLFRVTAEYTDKESHIDMLDTQKFNINPSLTFTNNEDTTFTLFGKVSRWKQQDYQGLPATGTVTGNISIDPELYIGPQDIGDSRSDFDAVWGIFEHQINDRWQFTVKGRYANAEHDTISQGIFGSDGFKADQPFFPPSSWALTNVELYQEQEEISLQSYAQARFDSELTENTLLIGADYSRLEEDAFLDYDVFPIGLVDLTAPVFLPYTYSGARQTNQFTTSKTYGGYLQIQSTILDRLHLLAAARYGVIDTDFASQRFSADSNEGRWLPNVGILFDITDKVAVFANYNEGMRAQTSTNFVSEPKPELSRQKEMGIKFDADQQLTGQVALYQIDREDIAVTDFTDPFFRAVAKGKQRSQGVEANMIWQGQNGLSLLAAYTYTQAEFRDSLAGVPEGNDLPGVPKHAGRLWANYTLQDADYRGWHIGAGVYAQSDSYLSNANLFKAEGYYTVDASLRYEDPRYKFGLSVKNLTDKSYFQRLNYYGSRVTPAKGRALFVSGAIRF